MAIRSLPVRRRPAILRAVAERRPALWRTSAISSWRALHDWSPATLAEHIPWALARVQPAGEREFVLTHDRQGSAPLLARTFEPLSSARANVSVHHILGPNRRLPPDDHLVTI